MHSRKNVILLWVMLLCAVFMTSGCKRDTGEENALVSVKQADMLTDIENSEGEDSEDAGDAAGEKTLDKLNADSEAEKADMSKAEKASADISEAEGVGIIYVDVCGHVKNPGVYQLTKESRVYEAIEKAGGMTKDAASASINQAQQLTDGQQIYIPSKAEHEEGRVRGTSSNGADADGGNTKADIASVAEGNGKVNLNTASKEELLSLTGIGDVKADSIIRYREQHGDFQSVEDIKKIEGIKDGVFNKIKDQITV